MFVLHWQLIWLGQSVRLRTIKKIHNSSAFWKAVIQIFIVISSYSWKCKETQLLQVSHFYAQYDPKDPLNINSEKYRKWESRFFRLFPTKNRGVEQISTDEKRTRARRIFGFFIFLIFQIILGIFLWRLPANISAKSINSDTQSLDSDS